MIGLDSSRPPSDRDSWDNWYSSSLQPRLELFGETKPVLCTNLTETLPTHIMSNDPQMKADASIYEYFWTISISQRLYDQFTQHVEHIVDKEVDKLRHHDTGAEVTLYFPLTGGWQAEEVVATIRYVRPLPHQEELAKKVAEHWNTVAPIISGIADITGKLPPPVPTTAGLPVSTAASLLSMLAKIPITSLPPVDGLTWSVKKVPGYAEYMQAGIMDGVRWTLPKKLFLILGQRVTGSVAVYFHPTHPRTKPLEPRPIQAMAVVYHDGQQIGTIGEEKYLRLVVTPEPHCVT